MRRHRIGGVRALARRLVAWAATLSVLASLAPASAQEPEVFADLGRLVPPEAPLVVAIDLREESPSLKNLLALLRPQERAVGAAGLLALAQAGLASVVPGLDVEEDVLPWIGRRAYVVVLQAAGGGNVRPLLLVEVRDAERARQALEERLRKAAAAGGGTVARRSVAGTTVYHLRSPRAGNFHVALREGALASSPDAAALDAWLQRAPGGAAPGPVWARALQSLTPGLIMAGVSPALLDRQRAQSVAGIGFTAAALSLSLPAEGLRLEVAADTGGGQANSPAATAAAQLAETRVTGQALAAVPATALASITIAPLGGLVKATGAEALVGTALGQLLGARRDELMPRLRPWVDGLLQGETALALLAVAPQPRWMGAIAVREGEAAPGLPLLREALAGIPNATVAADPAGGPGFTVTLPGNRPLKVHFTATSKHVLLASDREALQAAAAAAQSPEPTGLATSPVYLAVHQQLGQEAAVRLFVDTRALAREAMTLAHPGLGKQIELDLPLKYVTRLTDALLLPAGGAGLSLSARDEVARATLFQQVEWQKASGTAPLLAAAATGFLVVRAERTSPTSTPVALPIPWLGAAQRQACLSNMRNLAMSLLLYAQDYDERLPPAADWRSRLRPYLWKEQILRCPADPQAHPSSYALNRRIGGRYLREFRKPAETIAFFETTATGPSPADVGASLASPPRHGGGNNFVFLDGHAKWMQVVPASAWGPPPASARPRPRLPTKKVARPTRRPARR